MLSVSEILGLFIQIFTGGILFAGFYTFALRAAKARHMQREDVFLSIICLLLFLNLSALIAGFLLEGAQVLPSLWIPLLRSVAAFSILASAVMGSLAILRQGSRRGVIISNIYYFAALALMMAVGLRSGFDLAARLLWPIMLFLMLLTIFALLQSDKDRKEKSLLTFEAYSLAILFVAGIAGVFLNAVVMQSAAFFGYSGWVLSHAIHRKSEIALRPLVYLRTRILFKLLLLFVVTIVIVVEATTLATIAVSKATLSKAVLEADEQISFNISEKLGASGVNGENCYISQRLLDQNITRITRGRKLYLADADGFVTAPDGSKTVFDYDRFIKNGGGEFVSPDGKNMVGAFSMGRATSCIVIAAQEEGDAYREIKKMEANSLIFVLLGIAAAATFGMLFAKDFEKSINMIILGTEAVRKGDLSHKIKSTGRDEIGRLAKDFNAMVVGLKESQSFMIASEKLAALGTMAAGMAHEIKNPLVAIRTFTQLLPLKYHDKEFIDKFCAVVSPEIDKINRIAENLLKFGKPSKPEMKLLNINEVLEEILDLLENQFKKNGIRVATKLVKVPLIMGDQGQLSQAFLNIMLNAVQAMPKGGELIIKSDVGHVIQLGNITKEGFVAKKKSEDEEKVESVFVEVTDSGEGIGDDKIKNIFDPFFTTKASGTGMGLPITLRIIEEHGGSLKLRSQIGKGTTFIVILPQTRPDQTT